MPVRIWQNPRCGNSRGALALIREAGIEPQVYDYLHAPPDAATLKALLGRMGIGARALLREKEAAYAELGLDDAALDDDALVAAMAAHPILINRPIVETDKGAALCRPPEKVLALL